ncbi:signal transduction histidine kinase [Paenibacillus phyllosphaerae]|uniref:histidine kinase n=1 Tax=Paenibacillus phyllosphaerae TaxID=274593 RepID=A0A7W5AT85_9BACL|nr:HAMP domain-containing sensor histidine kinase [Paenibacillus phyllosphaerae]MBB3108365.1 signal transduction histidine kinase [Paenibacillus phyllosphaerae]
MSIRLKLTLWYSTLLAVTLLILGVSIYTFVNYNTYRDMKEQLQAGYKQVKVYAPGGDPSNLQFALGAGRIERNVYMQVVDYANGRFAQSNNLIDMNMQLPYPEKSANLTEGFVTMRVDKYNFLAYQVPVELNGEVVALIQSAAYTGREDQYLYDLRTILIFSSVAVVLLTFTTGLFIARQALRPLKGIIQAANRVQDGSNLSVRIERGKPNDELGRLTDTLNGMLERIETTYNELDEAYNAQRRFVSDASHELRTPLTTIRGNIELLEKMWLPALESAGSKESTALTTISASHAELTREAMLDIAGESKRMSRLVNDLLSLARADAGQVMEKEVQPLQPLVEDVARRAQMLPRSAEWRIGDLSALDGVEVLANADYIRQLFFIFVENAFKYTSSGYVDFYAVKADGQAGVVIKDTGIGMNSSEIPHIFDRFYRADESRGKTSGTGLGLSIAKWIIDEHNGSVEVSTREGEGTTFTVWLPVAFLDKPIQV